MSFRNNNHNVSVVLAMFFGCLCASQALAHVGPPVRVIVPPDRMVQAIDGAQFSGALEIQAGETGVLDDVTLSGEGWDVTLLTGLRPVEMQSGTTYLVEYVAIPADASKPLKFAATFEGRKFRKVIRPGEHVPGRVSKPGTVTSMDAQGRLIPFTPIVNREPANVSGQALRLHGVIGYMSPSTLSGMQDTFVGADNVYYEVIDEDDISTEVIHGGFTDTDGYFDIVVQWDDCDIAGCDDPDIYLRWELDNGVVAVQRSDIFEEDYSWSTEDETIDDFEGFDVDFGVVMPSDWGQHASMHIHNQITRVHRFIQTHGSVAIPRVEVQWPESEDGAWYTSFFEEIHIGPDEQWNEGTIIHEFGHHVLETQAENVSPDYCNDFCDGGGCTAGDDCEEEGHCMWCPETDHDAWNEGFPDWLASAVLRTFPTDYNITGLSANDNRWVLETTATCCQDMQVHPADVTEGYIAALLRDIEDSNLDDHSGGAYACLGPAAALDCTRDSLAMGPRPILEIAMIDDPITPAQFIQRFRARYPQHDQDFWSTATNISNSYTFVPPAPQVTNQTQQCAMNLAGQPLGINATANGASLKYQWQQNNIDLIDVGGVSGARCSNLMINPLQPGHSGVYRAEVSTCDESSSVMTEPIRVTVFPERGAGTKSGSWGLNNFGQLGRGVYDQTGPLYPSGFPAPMVTLSDAISISPGGEGWHRLAVKSNGDVLGWGANNYGQLGKDPNVLSHTHTPTLVEGVSNVIQTAVGVYSNIALRADGKVYTWGYNGYGQRGDGLYYGYNHVPLLVPDFDCVVSIAAGSYHVAAVKSDGTVWTWGYGYYGQLGWDPTGLQYLSSPTPRQVPGITDAVAVAAGGYHTLVLRGNGTVLAFGRNEEGQLGDGTQVTRFTPMPVPGLANVSAVRAGAFHSLVILEDGTVRGWGNNGGALGNGSSVRAFAPVQPLDIGAVLDVQGGYYHTMYLRADKTVWVSGWNVYGELGPRPYPEPLKPLPVAGISNALAIGAGWGVSFALSNGVGPYIWEQPQNVTALVGQSASFAIQHHGTPTFTYQWSRNGNDLVDGNGFSGANSPTLNLNPVAAAMGGTYRVRVQNLFGFTLSVMATLTVTCPNGDGNCDGMIDQVDVDGLADCINGPGGPRPAACEQGAFANFDANNDNDVDLKDAAVVQNCFAGEEFIDPACGQP